MYFFQKKEKARLLFFSFLLLLSFSPGFATVRALVKAAKANPLFAELEGI